MQSCDVLRDEEINYTKFVCAPNPVYLVKFLYPADLYVAFVLCLVWRNELFKVMQLCAHHQVFRVCILFGV